ncbi:MAG: CpaD family pilus assembly lipoprotein [Pseudomonadota bacterium]
MRAYRLVSLAGILGAALVLSACDASLPSQVQTGKVRLREQIVTEVLDSSRVDPARVNVLADHVKRNGRGAVTLTVSWLSGDARRAHVAERQGDAYKKAFEKRGVSGVHVATVPVADERYVNKVVVAYQALVALPSGDCGRITGYQGADNLEAIDQYKFGCETQMAVSRMIVDPSDLMGKAGAQDNDSRRAGASVEAYKAGTPNTPMQGFQASSIGTQ